MAGDDGHQDDAQVGPAVAQRVAEDHEQKVRLDGALVDLYMEGGGCMHLVDRKSDSAERSWSCMHIGR